MAYTDATPMTALLAGMAAVDAEACHEFARRQHIGGHDEDLATAAALLHDAAFAAQLTRPAELMAWKYPDTFEPLDTALLTEWLQAASNGDRAAIDQSIGKCRFADLAALSSIASYLGQSVAQIRRYGSRAADPQQALF